MEAGSTSKPMLVGMNNPQGNKPLVPYPTNCTGYRIYQMLNAKTGAFRIDYMNSFERLNLVDGHAWSAGAARANREAVLTRLRGRTAVLLGRAVWQALALPPTAPGLSVRPMEIRGGDACVEGEWFYLPHPSGLNRWYNDPENVDLAATLLAKLYTEYRSEVGLPLTSRRTDESQDHQEGAAS